MPKKKSALDDCEQTLRAMALDYPEAYEDHPWGECAFKVRKKVFLFMSHIDGVMGLSVKLPASHSLALKLAYTEPTGYGLGKHGWVSAKFSPDSEPPLGMLRDWMDESYRAVAPKKLLAQLDRE